MIFLNICALEISVKSNKSFFSISQITDNNLNNKGKDRKWSFRVIYSVYYCKQRNTFLTKQWIIEIIRYVIALNCLKYIPVVEWERDKVQLDSFNNAT